MVDSNDWEYKLLEFHQDFGHPTTPYRKASLDHRDTELRFDLIEEEFNELRHALDKDDIVEVADALGDMMYVIIGAALVWGIPIGQVFNEIHRSNMSKLGEDGSPIYREDGKILKGPHYSPPDLSFVKPSEE